MSDIQYAMRDNYRIHPAFRFEQECWKIAPEALAFFDATYGSAQSMGSVLSSDGWSALSKDCHQILQEIFDEIEDQVADIHENHFVAELRSECGRLLGEELGWHRRPRLPDCASLEDNHTRENAIAMQSERHFFGTLPADVVEEIQRVAGPSLQRFRANAAAGRVTRDDLQDNSSRDVVGYIITILNRTFGRSGVLDAVSAYAGGRMRVGGLSLELSVPQSTWWKNSISGLERPAHTLYAHLDESISFPKSIVYITDVMAETGPTGCYPGAYEALALSPLQAIVGRIVGSVGNAPDSPLKEYYGKQYHQSVNSENFRRHFMRLPENLRFNSHLGWDVMPGSEFEHHLVSREKIMLGPAGTYIVFDGARLLHRGGLMQRGERVALQVIFSPARSLPQRMVKEVKRILR